LTKAEFIMKNIRISLALVALVLAVTASSFTNKMAGELVWFDQPSGYAFDFYGNTTDAETHFSASTSGTTRVAVGYNETRESTSNDPFVTNSIQRSGATVIAADLQLNSGNLVAGHSAIIDQQLFQ
jgi:hypothetical protein